MKMRSVISMGLVGLMAICCSPEDEDRCGDGYLWDGETCLPLDDTDMDAGADSGAEADSGPDADAGDNLPTGLGEPCTEGGGECAGFEAGYCTANPFAPNGYCTVKDCSLSPDNCPAGHICCDIQTDETSPSFCATEDDFTTMSALGVCQGQRTAGEGP